MTPLPRLNAISARPELILGPLLRHVGERDATVWVETDEACEVEILGHAEPTFSDDEEREWLWAQAEGDFDHLLMATSDPFLL